ncbi:Dabb family protein [Marinimicrobium alkaliphilum]|uniref:Dabb family protein n=1 Tax=Marinimicrobium alkaliphilum TaxID=2202654 RepID=UPI000DBA91B5|nr:Dabb family protein [Marinimicrobium alkaliphilum]
MIRHILLIKFNSQATAEKLKDLRALFESMPDAVSGVESVEWGLNDSPEGKNQGYTHAVVMNFTDESARQAYLPHPAHDALKAVFIPLLDDIIVFDYTVD